MTLVIQDVVKEFKTVKAVDRVSCELKAGVYGLLGVNGAGKTSLMRMLCTLLKPTSGKILWQNQDIFEMQAEYRQILGYLPQDFGFYPDLSVTDYLLYIASLKGLRPYLAKKRSQFLLAEVGLIQHQRQKMRTLSGGMLRRVGIAQALLNDPKILILDEPTAGLDPNERIRFRNLISELANDRLVLLSTHIVPDIEFIASEILLMKQGQLFLTGSAETITSSMEDRVWQCRVARAEVESYLKHYLVANLKMLADGAELRILAKQAPTENALFQTPTLEDAFLHYFGEKSGEKNDA